MKRRVITEAHVRDIGTANDNLRHARDLLRGAGSHKAANYVQRALKSSEGAFNNAWSKYQRAKREGGAA